MSEDPKPLDIPTLFAAMEKTTSAEDIDKVLREHCSIGLVECAQALSESLLERTEELMPDMVNLAPYGNYEKLTEDPVVMLQFLKEEASKPENWEFQFISAKKEGNQIMELIFYNKAVDDGDLLKGFVFMGVSGKIRHAFTQVHS